MPIWQVVSSISAQHHVVAFAKFEVAMALCIDASNWPSFGRLTIPWPAPGVPNHIACFEKVSQWLDFLSQFDLHPAVPWPTATKYLRAQKLYAYAWLEFDFVKAGELMALAALEGALRDCYGRKAVAVRAEHKDRGEPMLAELMTYVIENDGLTDRIFPFSQRYRQRPEERVVEALYESSSDREKRRVSTKAVKRSPSVSMVAPPITLATIRNGLAHGELLEGWPWAGLLEIVKDLIEYAYRARITEVSANPDLLRFP